MGWWKLPTLQAEELDSFTSREHIYVNLVSNLEQQPAEDKLIIIDAAESPKSRTAANPTSKERVSLLVSSQILCVCVIKALVIVRLS